ncbi:hypothetical protein [Chlorogloeopsis sp. ULAP02]|uniref:hypothetical protein n=1 Tax=Chlorogloeopsis sp. ULAP02 TaxID=3107926 RepID=UPI003136C8CF
MSLWLLYKCAHEANSTSQEAPQSPSQTQQIPTILVKLAKAIANIYPSSAVHFNSDDTETRSY